MDISEKAVKYVRRNKSNLISSYVDSKIEYRSKDPECFFMAGSPGAGKTEVSISLIQNISDETKRSYVRIDADEIRDFIPYYNKRNSMEIQHAASIGVHLLFDHVMSKTYNFLLDGTFASIKTVEINISRCIERNYKINILYVYQDPKVAWDFTKKREKLEGRPVPKNKFVNAYFASRKNVNIIKSKYGKQVNLYLIIKDINNKVEKTYFNIPSVDHYLKEKYDRKSLQGMLQ